MVDEYAIRFRPYPMIRFVLSIGCLMVLVGSIILVLGIAAESSGYPSFKYLLIGAAVTLLGFLTWNKMRRKRRSTRFSLFRKREREDERDQRDFDEDRYDD
jgi:drug/metabolite transporter (DMT)-like permease